MANKGIFYNKTNTCDECEGKLISRKVRRETNKEGNWTGRWLCRPCYDRLYRPENSYYDGLKKITSSRTGNLDPNCTSGKGYIGQRVTCKVRGIKDLNIENDNFNSPNDHSIDPEFGILQSKIAFFEVKYNRWHVSTSSEKRKIYDYIIIYCIENEHIVRGYIIPEYDVRGLCGISLAKNPNRGIQWYEKYRIKDINPYDNAYQEILQDIEEGKDAILRRLNNYE